MSFIDTVVKQFIRRGREADVPAFGSGATNGQSYPTGHEFVHAVTGHRYVNIGPPNYSMHVCPGVNRFELDERFDLKPILLASFDLNATFSDTEAQNAIIANKSFILSGTNAVAGSVTHADGGGIKLTTAGANNDQVLVGTTTTTPGPGGSAWGVAKWNTLDHCSYEQVVTTSSSVAAQKIYAGFKLTTTPLAATDNDQAYFLFDTGNTDGASATNWIAVTSRAGTDTFVDTGVAVAASTSYRLRILIDGRRVPWFYINGVLKAFGGGTASTGATTGTTHVLASDIDMKPTFGIQALTAAAKNAIFRPLKCGKSFND